MNINRNMSRISWQIIRQNERPVKIYSKNKKVTMVYPAHVFFDFVTSLTLLFTLKLTPSYSSRPSIQHVHVPQIKDFLRISLCNSQIFRQYPKLETNSYFKLLQNRHIINHLHAVSALRFYVTIYARYLYFLFRLCFAIISSESQREYFYTTDLFIEYSCFVYI